MRRTRILPCHNLTPPPEKSEYDFDADRCWRAVQMINNLCVNKRDIEALEALITDIEALHRAAQARDRLLKDMNDLPCCEDQNRGVYVLMDDVDQLINDHQNSEYQPIADLSL